MYVLLMFRLKSLRPLRQCSVACFLALGCLSSLAQSPADQTFRLPGPTAVARTVQSKLADFVNVRDYGAVCDGGKTDDRVAIQNAIVAIAGGTLYFPSPGCGVSYPGVFTYPDNTGTTLRGQSQISAGYYAPGAGGGLVAYGAAPAFPITGCSAAELLVSCTTAANTLTNGQTINIAGIVNTAVADYCHACSGLNDAKAGGTYDGKGSAIYGVTITTVGIPDKFTWRLNGVIQATDVPITGSVQALSAGVTVEFGASTGHRLKDFWTISPSGFNLQDGIAIVTDSTHFSYYVHSRPAGTYVSGGSVSPSWALLTLYGRSETLENLFLDGNNKAAPHGVVSPMGLNTDNHRVTTREFSGDGYQVWDEDTPVAQILSGGAIGSTSMTLSGLTNNGLTFGTWYCPYVALDYGLPTMEYLTVAGTNPSINALRTTTPLRYSHRTARCHGNSNTMNFDFYSSYANGGWGFHLIAGPDSNGMKMLFTNSNSNQSGGDFFEGGSEHVDLYGTYEGDSGPAIQLGATWGASGTAGGLYGDMVDSEENDPAFSAVVAVCTSTDRIQFRSRNQVSFSNSHASYPTPQTCRTYPDGTSATATGVGNSNGQYIVMTHAGGMIFDPQSRNWISFFDPATDSRAGGAISPSDVTNGGLSFKRDVTDYSHAQIEAAGETQQDEKLMLGVRTDALSGFAQCTRYGSTTCPIILNPGGGAVTLGNGASSVNVPGVLTFGASARQPASFGAATATGRADITTKTTCTSTPVPPGGGTPLITCTSISTDAGHTHAQN